MPSTAHAQSVALHAQCCACCARSDPWQHPHPTTLFPLLPSLSVIHLPLQPVHAGGSRCQNLWAPRPGCPRRAASFPHRSSRSTQA
eukprot:1159842-Pelagomonas_calceolata.AAC.6